MTEVVHLVRREHDGGATCWCGVESPLGWQGGAASEDIDEATCLRCLEDAADHGRRCRHRALAVVKMPGALGQP